VGAGNHVLVPSLVCREVLASVHVVGATPLFYPVTPQLSAAFDADESAGAAAVIAVNYFGFPQPLDALQRYCSRTGAALIEDNAHGFLSRDQDGRWLGSRGDAGVFSFRKTIAVPDGGAVVFNRAGVGEAPEPRPIHGVPTRYRLKQGFRRIARRLGPARTFRAIGAIRTARRMATGHTLPVSAPDAEVRIHEKPRPTALLYRDISVAQPELEVERRRALYELAGRLLDGTDARPAYRCLPPNTVPYGFPFFARAELAPSVAALLGRHGLQSVRWPDLPDPFAASAPPHYRQLAVVPFLW
jgi:hypothetical protein